MIPGIQTVSGWDQPVVLRPLGVEWEVTEQRTYTGHSGDQWVLPAGFRTDLASVPKWLRGVIDTWGIYTIAAVLHDLLCRIASGRILSFDSGPRVLRGHLGPGSRVVMLAPGTEGSYTGPHVAARYVSRRDADGLFRRELRVCGVPWPQRRLMWLAVRLGSGFSGGLSWRDAGATAVVLPLGLLLCLLALPSLTARWALNGLGWLCTQLGKS